MTLADISHGPDWAIWPVFLLLAVLSAVLLSGRGSWLISGYNTASPAKKACYDQTLLCRVTGAGLAVIALLILVMGLFDHLLPAAFAWVAVGIILAVAVVVVILSNTICRR